MLYASDANAGLVNFRASIISFIYSDKMKLINASGVEYDLSFTSSWINNYANNVSKGSLVELDTLIEKYGPAYKEQIPDFLWNGIKIKGKIYALPNYQVEYTHDSNNFRKDLGAEADFLKSHKYEVVYFSYAKPKLGTDMVTAALTGISTSSKNPERAMMLMNLMLSDKELLNLLTYGIENVHYKKVGENRIELLEASKNYSMFAWQLGNQFLAYLLPGQEDTVWEDTIKANNEAMPSVTLGFNIDMEPVKTEAAAVGAVYKKYEAVMLTAMLKPEEFLDKMKEEYKQAGLDALIEAVQKQLDEWRAENGK